MTVCSTCNDTHRMSLGERDVMCTRCPTPCWGCGKGGPFCTTTPCGCWCHRGPACSLCSRWLGREVSDGTHYNCRRSLAIHVSILLRNLVDLGIAARAFSLGLYNTECANVYPSVEWMPGCGKEAP